MFYRLKLYYYTLGTFVIYGVPANFPNGSVANPK